MSSVLVIGLRVTGEAVAPMLLAEGHDVVVVEERPGSGWETARDALVAAGATVLGGAPDDWAALLLDHAIELVVPSPGVPPSHAAIRAARARGVAVRSEIDVAAERIAVPLVAITGTNGKTTVTEMVTAMLRASGRQVACVGNIGTPLVTAVGAEVDVVVAEVSSFQLELTTSAWRPRVAALLNIADDHLDWHGGRDAYAAAKARIFANQRDDDVLVVNADDGAAATVAQHAPANRIDVGDDGAAVLRTRAGVDLLDAHELPRALPHDRTNSLVAAEVALAAGASVDAVRSVLREYRTLPHRVQLVADANGVGWYDDSKATNPHATVRAIAAFDSVVLCAGGRNKELDLSGLAADLERIRAVVAFGEAAPEVVAAFAGRRPVVVATDMDLVVQRAAELARTGDAVLLSPACASFDWYANYGERGDDFARAVRAHLETMEAVS